MKLAITGKGGVGKTTLTSLLAYLYTEQGRTVLAIDADPSPCLGAALGFDPAALQHLTPIAEMEDLIYERTGAQPGTMGGYFKLNPRVDDIPDRFAIHYIETPRENGVFGASGVGELPLTSPHVAIVNAIKAATGVRITHLPARPEKVLAGLRALAEQHDLVAGD